MHILHFALKFVQNRINITMDLMAANHSGRWHRSRCRRSYVLGDPTLTAQSSSTPTSYQQPDERPLRLPASCQTGSLPLTHAPTAIHE